MNYTINSPNSLNENVFSNFNSTVEQQLKELKKEIKELKEIIRDLNSELKKYLVKEELLDQL